ncbi:MAG: FAD:protein FMN transferase [Rickettsiales bacterium]|nr:FAD:protein FMN transferase [Rickettsiales bacterium]
MNRRRFLTLMGATAGTAMLPMPLLAAIKDQKLYRWRGILLGAETGFQLYHEEAGAAKALIDKAVSEIQRLESIFSLYQANSALSKLNRDGYLHEAPNELTTLLTQANHYSQLTKGAFDVTVQPLWKLYSKHPSPTPKQLQETLAKIDYRHVEIDENSLRLAHQSQITLNGIAQGFITDHITQMLKTEGITNTLVELGETRALGGHADGRNWNIGLRDSAGDISDIVSLDNRALATSGAYGTALGQHHHLLNPHTGKSAKHHTSVSILAPNATLADALSTGLSIMPYAQARAIIHTLDNVEARFS